MSKSKANEEERQREHLAFLLQVDESMLLKDPTMIKQHQEMRQAQQFLKKKKKVDDFDQKVSEEKAKKESQGNQKTQKALSNLIMSQKNIDVQYEKKMDDQHKQRLIQMKQDLEDTSKALHEQQKQIKEKDQKNQIQKQKNEQEQSKLDKIEQKRQKDLFQKLLDDQKQTYKIQEDQNKLDLKRQIEKKKAEAINEIRSIDAKKTEEEQYRVNFQNMIKEDNKRTKLLEQLQKDDMAAQNVKLKATQKKYDKRQQDSQDIKANQINQAQEIKSKQQQKDALIMQKRQLQTDQFIEKNSKKRDDFQKRAKNNKQILEDKQLTPKISNSDDWEASQHIQEPKQINHKQRQRQKIVNDNLIEREFLSRMQQTTLIESQKDKKVYLGLLKEANKDLNDKIILSKKGRSLSIQNNRIKIHDLIELKNQSIMTRYIRPKRQAQSLNQNDLKLMIREYQIWSTKAHSQLMHASANHCTFNSTTNIRDKRTYS